jgi:hypothetical protein
MKHAWFKSNMFVLQWKIGVLIRDANISKTNIFCNGILKEKKFSFIWIGRMHLSTSNSFRIFTLNKCVPYFAREWLMLINRNSNDIKLSPFECVYLFFARHKNELTRKQKDFSIHLSTVEQLINPLYQHKWKIYE